MQFMRLSWKILVGVKDLFVLLFLALFFAAIFALLNANPNPAMVRDGALLLKLDGVVAEQPAEIDVLTTPPGQPADHPSQNVAPAWSPQNWRTLGDCSGR